MITSSHCERALSRIDACMPFAPTSDAAFLSGSALVFAASAAATLLGCLSMAAMSETICGAMSMWLPMPGQTWAGAAAAFLGMWIVMMVAMMLPSLVPMLWRYRATVGESPHLARLTALVGLGYFVVWTIIGLVVFPLGAALMATAMELPALARALPLASGVVVLIAGALQFSAWKAHELACCRGETGCDVLPAAGSTAWRHGLRLGMGCVRCCGNLMAILLVLGVMDLAVMAAVTAAITAERLAPAGARVAQATGAIALATGLVLITRAAGLV